ncbi:hypothetical protein ACOME3_009681 [Neoechinorhynchus agilis]
MTTRSDPSFRILSSRTHGGFRHCSFIQDSAPSHPINQQPIKRNSKVNECSWDSSYTANELSIAQSTDYIPKTWYFEPMRLNTSAFVQSNRPVSMKSISNLGLLDSNAKSSPVVYKTRSTTNGQYSLSWIKPPCTNKQACYSRSSMNESLFGAEPGIIRQHYIPRYRERIVEKRTTQYRTPFVPATQI